MLDVLLKSAGASSLRAAIVATGLLAAVPLASPLTAQTLSSPVWRITYLTGLDTIVGEPELRFDGTSVVGRGGCNRFSGNVVQDGQSLRFGPLASTRMACPPPMDMTERAVFEALAATERFALTPGGALELLGVDGLLLRAEP